MSEQLTVCLIAVAVNLVGVLSLYAVMAQAITRFAWRRRGIFGVIALIILAQLFWIVPALLIVVPRESEGISSYALWFGNWLVSGFSLTLFWKAATRVPLALQDTARMDGLGGFATWRHAVLPFVRHDLALLALFTVMATVPSFWGFATLPQAGNSIALFQRFLSPQGRLAMMVAASLAGTLPLIAIFFLAKRSQPVR